MLVPVNLQVSCSYVARKKRRGKSCISGQRSSVQIKVKNTERGERNNDKTICVLHHIEQQQKLTL
ncbi:uncharacterized protein LOC119651622 isoform X2 [Hermetia illucens]|uniref:uncharacterized protein LOC119651622 isoform X2 n=1 Tax=Hermetia illucens TaxID=343691 RepID=UPI0018CC6ED4|nr:uncharacterized protein LOC119651622 isoform X2 [Hermetia illucens]